MFRMFRESDLPVGFNGTVKGVIDDDLGPALTRFLDSLPARPRLLGLGEPMHGEEEFLRVRNLLFRRLVAHEGYRSIAIESDCLAGLAVDAFVTGGPGSVDEVMATGFSYGFGASSANRQLVAWMWRYNEGRAPVDRLRFDGFDAPLEMTSAASPRSPLTALYEYLAANVDAALLPRDAAAIDRLAGDDVRWTDTAAVMDPSRSVGATAEARALPAEYGRSVAQQDSHDVGSLEVGRDRRRGWTPSDPAGYDAAAPVRAN